MSGSRSIHQGAELDAPGGDGAPPPGVVMPARNALPHLDSSIESLLGQSFGDFELVIRDDVRPARI